MGWLFSSAWPTRNHLIQHLVEGNGVKTLRKAFVGNNMWAVQEYVRDGQPVRFVILYKLARHGKGLDGWGYKDIDESMGPTETSCPVSFLDDLSPPYNEYSKNWREKVVARAMREQLAKPGSKWKYNGKEYEVIKRRSPTAFLLKSQTGTFIRAGKWFFHAAEPINTEESKVSSWKPVFQMPNDPKWYDNAQRFATKEEALASAEARFMVWTMPTAFDAHESNDPVNYQRVDGVDVSFATNSGHTAQPVTV